MTSAPFVFRGSWARLRYARARLLLGISAVGTVVVVAASTLALDLPQRVLSTDARQPWWMALSSIGVVMAYTIVAFACFDLVGGAMFVRRAVRPGQWLRSWARGVLVQWCIWMLSAASLLLAFRQSGPLGGIVVFIALQLVLAALRGRLSTLVASMPNTAPSASLVDAAREAGVVPESLLVVDAADESFVGGWAGIRARRLVVPSLWTSLPKPTLVAILARRRVIGASGAHVRGVLGAVAWNCLGFSLVVAIILVLTRISLTSAAGILTLSAGMTLWSFAGVLVLPTLSRSAVYVADRDGAALAGVAAVSAAILAVDHWQDDEPIRANLVEVIFHPVPARASRLAQLTKPSRRLAWMLPQAHHIARHALWLSWASLSPLARAVHCNVGRPALWVMLPGD